MIIIDYMQMGMIIATSLNSDERTLDNIRHVYFNTLIKVKKRFGNKYGRVVIATEGGHTWRKEKFPQYKANRKRDREKSKIDWDYIIKSLRTLEDEFKDNLPIPVVKTPRAEGDDIIAILTKNFHSTEPILIVSSDHDFIQLLVYENVEIYRIMQDEFVSRVGGIFA